MLIITDHTITTGGVTQKLLGGLKTAAQARAACAVFGVQNKHATQDLFVKAGVAGSTADNSTDSVLVRAGEYLVLAPISAANGHDADAVYVFSSLTTHSYSVVRVVH